MTRLDTTHAIMMRDDQDDAARLQFYSELADTELFMLLETETGSDQIQPRLFDLEGGPVVLAFDLEERLSAFAGGPAPYAALPGRVIAAQLAGQGIGLGLNIGDSPSSIILPADVMDWLTATLTIKPIEVLAVPQGFSYPSGIPAAVSERLFEKLNSNMGLADTVLLAEVVYEKGRRGHILAVVGAKPGTETALAGSVSEAIIFSGMDMAEIDVVFLDANDRRTRAMEDVALRLDLPKPHFETPPDRTIPGMDPGRPPVLR
jgi:SseB protein N-terminal domain